METAQDILHRARLVVLDETSVVPGLLDKVSFVVTFVEETAFVAEHFRLEYQDIGNASLDDVHDCRLSFRISARYSP
jgi:hypothetical protein